MAADEGTASVWNREAEAGEGRSSLIIVRTSPSTRDSWAGPHAPTPACREAVRSSGRPVVRLDIGAGFYHNGRRVSHPRTVRLRVNGREVTAVAEPRRLLSDFLRHDLGLTGTHVGCEHGVCGACTVQLDGEAVRSCLLFAIQGEGHEITTVEGLGQPEALHPLQAAFRETHALQCGFCTPGVLMSLEAFLREHPRPTRTEIREALSGTLCRCTGYQKIVDAVELAAEGLAHREETP